MCGDKVQNAQYKDHKSSQLPKPTYTQIEKESIIAKEIQNLSPSKPVPKAHEQFSSHLIGIKLKQTTLLLSGTV